MVILIAFISGISGIFYGTTLMGSTYGSIFASFYRYFRPSINIVNHAIQGIMSNPDRLEIDMKHLDYEKLAHQVFNARQRGSITEVEKSVEVKAKIRFKGNEYESKIRLRGSFIEHVREDKWSFRVKIKDNNTIDGMSRFSLSSPELRNHIHEWLFQRNLQYEHLINLRYKFVQVYLNGKKLGVYALEEFFNKRLIENNSLREGLILRPDDLDNNAKPFLYEGNKLLKDSTTAEAYESLWRRIERYKRHEIPVDNLYDINKSAKYFALATIYGGQHGHLKENYACYLNPITNNLEPIGYDSNVSRLLSRYGGQIEAPTNAYHNSIFANQSTIPYLFSSKKFKNKYISQLIKMIQPEYFQNYFSEIEDELEHNLGILYKEYPYFDYLARNYISANIEYVRRQLYDEKLINISVLSSGSQNANILVDNLRDWPIELHGIVANGKIIYSEKYPEAISSTLKSDKHLVRMKHDDSIGEAPDTGENIYLLYNVFGCDSVLSYQFNQVDTRIILNRQQDNMANSNIASLGFSKSDIDDLVVYDDSLRYATLKSGSYSFSEDLIIRPGLTFIIEPGVLIDLTKSSKVVSYSTVKMIGTASKKIDFTSSDSTGQGLSVMNAENESTLMHVSFENMGSVNYDGWHLTGAVTFYESDVIISYCSFSNNRSEDALNIVRSNFTISNSSFTDIFSDAFDGDFVTGRILDSKYLNCANDGIDVSGSELFLENINIEECGDKGVSAGERSVINGSNIIIQNTEIGVASKDKSDVNIINISTNNVKVDITAFKKKPEYGSSIISVTDYTALDGENKFIIEKGSKLNIESQQLLGEEENVEALLYGNLYGRSSR